MKGNGTTGEWNAVLYFTRFLSVFPVVYRTSTNYYKNAVKTNKIPPEQLKESHQQETAGRKGSYATFLGINTIN